MKSQHHEEPNKSPFKLKLIEPYSTNRADGSPTPTPFIVDGLFTQGGLSVLGAKPKVGKSSLARYLAVAVAKGTDFLGRISTQGDVLLCSLEDPLSHVDNCLGALGYDRERDGKIHIVTEVSPDRNESIRAIRDELESSPNIRLVIIDHLAEFLNVADLSEYMPVHTGFKAIRDLARAFPHVHILTLAHAKKIRTDDPFDGYLGSTAIRGIPDTTVVLLEERNNRVIVSQTRAGRAIPATILAADVVTRAGSDVVQAYSLSAAFDQWSAKPEEDSDPSNLDVYCDRVLEYLQGCPEHSSEQQVLLKSVKGKTDRVLGAIRELISDNIIVANGTPKALHIIVNDNALKLYRMPTRKEIQ